jgi:hypothetical protein
LSRVALNNTEIDCWWATDDTFWFGFRFFFIIFSTDKEKERWKMRLLRENCSNIQINKQHRSGTRTIICSWRRSIAKMHIILLFRSTGNGSFGFCIIFVKEQLLFDLRESRKKRFGGR